MILKIIEIIFSFETICWVFLVYLLVIFIMFLNSISFLVDGFFEVIFCVFLASLPVFLLGHFIKSVIIKAAVFLFLFLIALCIRDYLKGRLKEDRGGYLWQLGFKNAKGEIEPIKFKNGIPLIAKRRKDFPFSIRKLVKNNPRDYCYKFVGALKSPEKYDLPAHRVYNDLFSEIDYMNKILGKS
jgi:energy-coupling factor transporter transmembrane protein EcfT